MLKRALRFLPTTLIVLLHWPSLEAERNDSGGWKFPHETAVGLDGPCTVERVSADSLGVDEFLKEYAYGKPVIITNYCNNDAFRRRCERAAMLTEWRHAAVTLNSANTYSYTRVPSTFGEYVESILAPQDINVPGDETLYLFGDIDQEVWRPLLADYRLPDYLLPDHEPALSFGIAGAGTGVPFHFHGPGFGEVLHGSKRWFLQPYDARPQFEPNKTTLHWYSNVYPSLPDDQRPLECLLKPGELIYFPDRWWHATLNAETSVFISTFLSPNAAARGAAGGGNRTELLFYIGRSCSASLHGDQ